MIRWLLRRREQRLAFESSVMQSLTTLLQRTDQMADDFSTLQTTVQQVGQAVTDTATRVQADLAALQAAQATNDQPTIDSLNSSLQDALSHLNAIGQAASTVTPDQPVTLPTPPASIADPSDPTTVATDTPAS